MEIRTGLRAQQGKDAIASRINMATGGCRSNIRANLKESWKASQLVSCDALTGMVKSWETGSALRVEKPFKHLSLHVFQLTGGFGPF